jgi:predicted ATP-grasp superfamily ATP-dependent carboligase
MSALITDADQVRCLTVAQSLAKKGISVTIAGERGCQNIAFYWGYSKKRNIIYPSPDDEELFVRTLIRACRNHDVLIPLHERTIVPISKHLQDFTKIIGVSIPNYQTLKVSLDKAETIEVAKRLGIPTPRTYFINRLSELRQLSKKIHYPVVIKLRKEIFTPPPRYTYAYSPTELIVKYQEMHQKCEYPLIQELIKGIGFGFFALFDKNSVPIATFCHRRIREYPITGGPSTYCESVYEPKIIDYGIKLLKGIKWCGPAMVEFRKDYDGEFSLMEINPRFWGSLPLAIASGIDFPYLLYQMDVGSTIEPIVGYKIGVKYSFLYYDFLALKQALHTSGNKIDYLWNFTRSFWDRDVHSDLSIYIKGLIMKVAKMKV